MVEFASNGGTCQGYLAVPASGSGPGVVVIQEWWGVVPHIKNVCDRLAAEGFVALAPDLYDGKTTTEPDEAGKLMMALRMSEAAKDMGGAADHLLSLAAVTSRTVGVLGFCMGGGLALYLAAVRPDVVSACVPFYGIMPWPDFDPDWSQMNASVLGHFAENDGFFSPDKVREFEKTLKSHGKDVEIFIHPGVQHAFYNDDRPEVHDPKTAAEAFRSTVAFFHDQLG
jgi:carboxymethylenebutenolidase